MPDAATYPLMRVRRRRRLRVPWRRLLRPAAALAIVAMLVAGIVIARRPVPPDPRALLVTARANLAEGNYSAARHNAERAVAAAPRWAAAHRLLARAYLKLGDGLAAEGELARAGAADAATRAEARLLQGDAAGAQAIAELAPGDTAAGRVRARALAAQGQRGAGQAALAALARGSRDPGVWTDLGRLRLDAGEVGGATEATAASVRLAPREPAALTLQGEVVRARYGLVAALPWFAAALRCDAYYPPALLEQAATLAEAGRYGEALAASRAALLARPGSPAALYIQAAIAARAGRLELAQRLLDAGGALDGLPAAVLLQGVLDQAAGRREQAVARWRRLLAIQPLNLDARRLLGEALLRQGDAPGALDVLKPLAVRDDADSYALMLTARAWEAAGERGAAAFFLDRAAAGARGTATLFATDDPAGALRAEAGAAPSDPTYALGVIRGLMGEGDRAGALARARALAGAAPGAPAAQLALGDTLAATAAWAPAAAAYARAADLRFDEPTAFRLIDALGRVGRARDAAGTLALFLSQNPQSLPARRLLGHWQVAAGRWEDAIATLEEVRGRTGDRDAGLLADLALAYAGDGEGAVARVYARAAYRLLPMSAAVCDAYGVALAADGAVDGARQLFAKAIALTPGDPVPRGHLRQLG